MKKSNLIVGILSIVLLFSLTNCKKESRPSLNLVSPILDRNFNVIGTSQKKFSSKEEFISFIERGLKNLKFDVKMPRIKKYFKLEGQDNVSNLTFDYNPCPNNSPMGEGGGHNMQEGIHTSETGASLAGLNLGLDLQVGYGVTSSNQLTPLGGGAFITGSGAIPTSQTNSGTTFISGTNVSTVGSISATWTSGYSGTFSGTSSNTISGSGGFNVNMSPITLSGNGGATYNNSVTWGQSYSGVSAVTAQIAYEMNEDICTGTGSLKVWVNSALVVDIALTP